MPDDATPAKPRRSLPRRIIGWCLALGVLLALALTAASWWMWTQRVVYLNGLFTSFGPLHGSVEDLTVSPEGMSLRGIELRDPETGDLVLRLPELKVHGGWHQFLKHQVDSVSINDVEVTLSEPFLERLLNQAEDTGSTSFTLPGGWKIGHVELRNARLRYEERDGTVAELVANYHARDISTLDDGALDVGQHDFEIHGGRLAHGENPLKLGELQAHGQIRDGIVDLKTLSVDKLDLALTPEFLDFLTPDSVKGSKAQPVATPQASPSPTQRAASLVRGVRIGNLDFKRIELSTAGFRPGNVSGLTLPDALARFDYETSNLEWLPDGATSTDVQRLRLAHLEIKPNGEGEGLFLCRDVNVELPPPKNGQWRVGQLTLVSPEIHWTPQLHKILIPESGASPSNDVSGSSKPWSVVFENFEIREANVSFSDPAWLPFAIQSKATLSLQDMRLDANGAHSTGEQVLRARDMSFSYPSRNPEKPLKPFLEIPSGILGVKIDEWNASTSVATLELNQPIMRLRDGNTTWFDAEIEGAAKQEEQPPSKANEDIPFWEKLHFVHCAITDGALDYAPVREGHTMEALSRFTFTTDDAKPGLHRLRFENFEARLPGLTLFPFPVARVSFVEISALLPDVWRSHRLEHLHIGGAKIEASDALMKFFNPPAKAADVPSAPAPNEKSSGPEWKAASFKIADSSVTLSHLIPGMDTVTFNVSLDIDDAPLSPAGLEADVAPQRVELANLLIPSPYGGSPVAKLDSIFVEFSPAGLIAKRIDKVEIVSPTLFIGEPLFWYVDYYRQYAANTSKGAELKVAVLDKPFALQAAAAAVAQVQSETGAGWNLRTLQVHRGKLVIAPKGVPLAGIRTPFPFSFTSELSSGSLQADFQIPSDNYEFPAFHLAFEGLSGKVQFNLPLKERDNNLTEVFKVKRIRWKELHLDDGFLSVTYDAGGIYGKFGGAAYNGYVNGGINVYNDADYSWDGWISGNTETRELTEKLFPKYFLMEGKVSTTITAVGDGQELYQTVGKFDGETPGRVSIQALNDLIKELPDYLDFLKLQLAQIGLETLGA